MFTFIYCINVIFFHTHILNISFVIRIILVRKIEKYVRLEIPDKAKVLIYCLLLKIWWIKHLRSVNIWQDKGIHSVFTCLVHTNFRSSIVWICIWRTKFYTGGSTCVRYIINFFFRNLLLILIKAEYTDVNKIY